MTPLKKWNGPRKGGAWEKVVGLLHGCIERTLPESVEFHQKSTETNGGGEPSQLSKKEGVVGFGYN